MKIEKLNKDNIKEFIRDIDTAEEIELNINKLEYYAVKEDDIYLLAFEMLSDEDKISIKYVNNKVKEDKFLHASTKGGVIYSSMNSPYWKKAFWQVRRV